MGGGGDDGGYQAQQAALEAKKQAARDALNLQFGVAPANPVAAPTREQFTKTTPGGDVWESYGGVEDGGSRLVGTSPGTTTFDQAGYDAALAASNAGSAAATNKTARDALYQSVRDNAYTAGKRRLDEQRDEAARKLKFELFAKGLSGGSEDVNQNAKLGRTYSSGLIDLGGRADAAKADFQGQDESARLGLLQSIDSGVDQGSALSSAISQQAINADKAAAAATGTTLGDLFSTGGELYNQSQMRLGKQAGQDWWNDYSRSSGKKAGSSATGTVTSGAYYGG